MSISKKIIQFVIDSRESDKKQPFQRIANKVAKELHQDISAEECKRIWQEAKDKFIPEIEEQKKQATAAKSELQRLNEDTQEANLYDFIDDHYILYKTVNSPEGKKKEVYKLKLSTVDSIFNDFSKHGANMSGEAIQKKYKLKARVRQLVKSQIGLYKDSHIMSPMSMDNAEKAGTIDEVIMEATYNNFQDRYKDKYNDADVSVMRREYKKLMKQQGTLEGVLEHLAPWINQREPINLKVKTPKPSAELVIAFGDPHWGKMNTHMVDDRLDLMTADIIDHPKKDIVIFCLGDLFETLVQGGMHNGQIETMDLYGYELFMHVVNKLENMLVAIHSVGKNVSFIGIGGNHDRASMNNEGDRQRIFALLAYQFLKRGLEKTKIEITLVREKTEKFKVGTINYITNHGEEVNRKKMEVVAWNYGDNSGENVILTAHLHNVNIQEGKNLTAARVPALAGQNQYDKDNGWFAHPGYLIVEENDYGKPDLTLKRLP